MNEAGVLAENSSKMEEEKNEVEKDSVNLNKCRFTASDLGNNSEDL